MTDFDRIIERRGTHASKWDNIARYSGIDAEDAIPMWVADMDFQAPPALLRHFWLRSIAACMATTPIRAPGRMHFVVG